jgi:hypothetical protein
MVIEFLSELLNRDPDMRTEAIGTPLPDVATMRNSRQVRAPR